MAEKLSPSILNGLRQQELNENYVKTKREKKNETKLKKKIQNRKVNEQTMAPHPGPIFLKVD